LSTSTTPEPLPIRGDRIQLQQVIVNLIVNGIDAMSDMPSTKRKIIIRTTRIPDFAEVTISDAGPGITPDKLKEVFEPFFTIKTQGMGMGLSIARTIVEAHNGQIIAENHIAACDMSIRLTNRRSDGEVGVAQATNKKIMPVTRNTSCPA
jgi:signal transduction histidine kinase